MKYYSFNVTVKHSDGEYDFTVIAMSESDAIRMVITSENCKREDITIR